MTVWLLGGTLQYLSFQAELINILVLTLDQMSPVRCEIEKKLQRLVSQLCGSPQSFGSFVLQPVTLLFLSLSFNLITLISNSRRSFPANKLEVQQSTGRVGKPAVSHPGASVRQYVHCFAINTTPIMANVALSLLGM